MRPEIQRIARGLADVGYVADRPIATTVHLALSMEKPLLVEGAAGVGKTEIAKALATFLGSEIIRLQCYEGLDLATAAYEWNYPKQLLHIRLSGDGNPADFEKENFGADYLLERTLLRAIRTAVPCVLLIDEVDRADEEFEAFLLELLSDFQISIPELGTVRAERRPIVVLTSNGTRELSDALRRRCLYLWIEYPDAAKELEILERRAPGVTPQRAADAVRLAQRLRGERLSKTPGVAETLDFALALQTLDAERFDADAVRDALAALVKDPNDLASLTAERIDELLATEGTRAPEVPAE